jgi:uncharacterized lipoprotein YmbA
MNQRKTRQLGIILSGLALALAGCSLLPEPKADPTKFYVLTTPATPVAAARVTTVVQLRPVEVAGYLRSPALVVRRGENEIEFRDQARWGESLDLGIARVLKEELRARGIEAGTGPGSGGQLSVRVLACEGTASGGVNFRAAWELTDVGTASRRGGTFQAADLRWDGKSESTLAAQLSEAVAGLAAEIVQAMAAR